MTQKELVLKAPDISPMHRVGSMTVDETLGAGEFIGEAIVAASNSECTWDATCAWLANWHVKFRVERKLNECRELVKEFME